MRIPSNGPDDEPYAKFFVSHFAVYTFGVVLHHDGERIAFLTPETTGGKHAHFIFSDPHVTAGPKNADHIVSALQRLVLTCVPEFLRPFKHLIGLCVYMDNFRAQKCGTFVCYLDNLLEIGAVILQCAVRRKLSRLVRPSARLLLASRPRQKPC